MPEENSIRLGITPEGFESAAQRVNEFHRTLRDSITSLAVDSSDFVTNWAAKWQELGADKSYVRFTQESSESLRQLNQDAEVVLSTLKQIQTEGMDTGAFSQQVQKVQGVIAQLERARRSETTAVEQIQGGAKMAPGFAAQAPYQDLFDKLDDAIGGMAETADQVFGKMQQARFAQLPEGEAKGGLLDQFGRPMQAPAPPGGEGMEATVSSMDMLNLAFVRLISNVERLNQTIEGRDEGAERERARERARGGRGGGGEGGGGGPPQRRRGPASIEERLFQRISPFMGRGMAQDVLREQIGRGLAARTAGGGGTGILSRLGGVGMGALRGLGGMAGGGAATGAMMVAAPLAVAGAGMYLFGKGRQMAQQYEEQTQDIFKMTRQIGTGRREEYEALRETFQPGGRFVSKERQQLGYSLEEQMGAIRGLTTSHLFGYGRGITPGEATAGDLAGQVGQFLDAITVFSRSQGVNVQQAGDFASRFMQLGVAPQELGSVMNQVMAEAMTEGVSKGIGRSTTMQAVLTLSERHLQKLGELDANSVANATAIVTSFNQSGIGAFMAGRGGERMQSEVLGVLESGAQSDMKMAVFHRAARQAAAAQGMQTEGQFGDFLNQLGGNIIRDQAMRDTFEQLDSYQKLEYLVSTIGSNPEMMSQILPQMFPEGMDEVHRNMLMNVMGFSSPEQRLQFSTLLKGGFSERLGMETQASKFRAGIRTLTQDERQRVRDYRDLGVEGFQEKYGAEQLQDVQRLNQVLELSETEVAGIAPGMAERRKSPVEEFLGKGLTETFFDQETRNIFQKSAQDKDFALQMSAVASKATLEMARDISDIKSIVGEGFGNILQAMGETPEQTAARRTKEINTAMDEERSKFNVQEVTPDGEQIPTAPFMELTVPEESARALRESTRQTNEQNMSREIDRTVADNHATRGH